MLNVTCIKIHSIVLSLTCHGLRTFPYSYTSPHIHSWIFNSLQLIIFWVRVTCKMLNLNWKKIHSIILFVTCHGLRNFSLLIHIPLYPFVNCWNPTSYYFLSLSFDPPHPTPTWPTPPHPHPYMTHLNLPHPFMTHPTPPLYDTPHPTPPHPCMTHPPHPTHPTPPLVHCWAQRSLFSWAASLCLPSVDNKWALDRGGCTLCCHMGLVWTSWGTIPFVYMSYSLNQLWHCTLTLHLLMFTSELLLA